MGSQRVGHDWATLALTFYKIGTALVPHLQMRNLESVRFLWLAEFHLTSEHQCWNPDSSAQINKNLCLWPDSAWFRARDSVSAHKVVAHIKVLAVGTTVMSIVAKMFWAKGWRKCLIWCVKREDTWRHVSFQGAGPQEIPQICTGGHWWGLVTEDQPFNVFEFFSSAGAWVIGSEFLDSGGMQAKARSPICQDFERNYG